MKPFAIVPNPKPIGKKEKKMKICSVNGCNKKHLAKGFCRNHYESISRRKTRRKYNKKYNKINRKKRIEYGRLFSKKYPEITRKRNLKSKHGLSLEQFNKLLIKQDYKCAICKKSLKETKNHIDHDHKTNIIRGILCDLCNVGLGYFRDDAKILKNAIKYLKQNISTSIHQGSPESKPPQMR